MKKLLFENLGLKISAVLISFFLWFFVTSIGQSEMAFEIPVKFKNIPAGMGIVKGSAKTVSVTIVGRENLLRNLNISDINVIVKLDKAEKGEGTYSVKKDDIKLPYGMSVIQIKPSSLKVRLEENVTKTVKIKPTITGIPEKGFSVRSIVIKPRRVVIRGLKSELKRINALRTEALDITGLNETISQELDIEIEGANVKPDINKVNVKIIIKEEMK
jgi:YbbR domain-containing protein